MIDSVLFYLLCLAVIAVAIVWGVLFCVLWVLDRVCGWIHRRARSFDKLRMKRPWR